jgi:magnesium transporter
MSALSDDVIAEVRELVASRDDALVRNLLPDLHISDVAGLLDSLDAEARAYLFDLLDDEARSSVLLELDERHRGQLVDEMAPREISEIVGRLESDDAADLVGELEDPVRDEVLRRLDRDDAQELRSLLAYPDDSADGIMASEFMLLPPGGTVEQAIHEMRARAGELGDIYNVFVAPEGGPLAGSVALRDLLIARRGARLEDVMTPTPTVPPEMDQEDVARLFRNYDVIEMPVVGSDGRMLGVITIDDVVDVMEEEAAQDMARFAGTVDESAAVDSVLHATSRRLPWLVVGLAGGLLAALVLSRYELSLKEVVSLAFFVPVINGMGGNVAMQSSAIAVRSLALGSGAYRALGRRVLKEFLVSVVNGLVCGVVLAVVVGFWLKMAWLALLIGASLFSVILIATTVGAFVPVTLDRMKIDPALAAGPFVTTANDVLGVIVYLSLAKLIIPHVR